MMPVAIAGMHRSGTSMITRLLNLCGLYLGDEKDLIPNAEDNPEGFWENTKFQEVNNEIFMALGGGWDIPPVLKNGWEKSPTLINAHINADRLIREFSDQAHWGWKDPRNSLTLPFWKALIPNLKTVICVRNPYEVYRSLERRGYASTTFSYNLWLTYNEQLLATTKPEERIITHYDTFFYDPQAELQRLVEFLGFDVSTEKIQEACKGITSNLRHNQGNLEKLRSTNASQNLINTYKDLCLEAGPTYYRSLSTESLTEIQETKTIVNGEVTEEYKRLMFSLNWQVKQKDELINKISKEIAQKDKLITELSQEKAQNEELIAKLSQEKIQKDELLDKLSQEAIHKSELIDEISKASTQKDELIAEISRETIQKSELIAEFSRKTAQADEFTAKLSQEIAQKEQEIAQKEQDIQQLNEKLNSANQEILNHRAEFNNIFQSRSWRLIKIVQRARTLIAPPGSLQARTLATIWRMPSRIRRNVLKTKIGKDIDVDILAKKTDLSYKEPVLKSPTVSIIIPVHNQIQYTLNCLLSIAASENQTSYEVIIVDDVSTDSTEKLLKNIVGIRYIRNKSNQGFLLNCNDAAKKAAGKYLVFLNNDTRVHKFWLDNLLATFSLIPETGLVGSKLIFPSGNLQEAGGVIWADGSAKNYGREDNPESYLYNYVREVDYVSGASIMIAKALWESLGGFDLQYQPAYYEDVDLAFKVRASGYKVIYQPFSEVTHYEGGSNGVDVNSGIKRYQVINQEKFFNTWQKVIENHGLPAQTPDYIQRNRYVKGQVLFIDDGTPKPDHYAGGVLSEFYITTIEKAGFAVTFLPHIDLRYTGHYTAALQKNGVECVYLPYVSSSHQYLIENGYRFDYVVISRANVGAEIIDFVKKFAPNAKVIFNTIDLHFLRLDRAAQLSGKDDDIEIANQVKDRELGIMRKADFTLVVSNIEEQILAKLASDVHVKVVPFPADIYETQKGFDERANIVFIGGFSHTPNIDAVLFFAKEIWPIVLKKLPNAKFIIAGAEITKDISRLESESILVKGFVENLDELFGTAKLSVAPLRFGAGIKGKVLTSLGYGVPCVTTGIASEGIGLTNGVNVLIANTPEEFADAVVEAYTSAELWQTLSTQGQDYMRQNYSRSVVASKLLEVFEPRMYKPGVRESVLPVDTMDLEPVLPVAAIESKPIGSINTFEVLYNGLLNTASNQGNTEYVPILTSENPIEKNPLKLIAYYLPQFHPIPENDAWWGTGFTEWTNVSKAVPEFVGHYQPHLPGELGFYDLRVPDVQKRQVELARKYGIHGFAFYYYWFNGKRLLEKPIDQFVSDPENDFPYCLFWANENWTRRWDGKDDDILIAQDHTPESDYAFIKDIEPYLRDKRYIRIDGKPILLVYRVQLLPNPQETAMRWRKYCRDVGIGEIYLIAGQVYGFYDPELVGFDAAVEFPPHNIQIERIDNTQKILNPNYSGQIFSYHDLVRFFSTTQSTTSYQLFKTVSPSWDNEPRKPGKGTSFIFSNPTSFQQWLKSACVYALKNDKEKQIVFINAWNEWGEGAHLEPDRRFGYGYLQAARNVLTELADVLPDIKAPVLVFQMSKVGSTSLYLTLRDMVLGVPVYAAHILNNFDEIERNILRARSDPQASLYTLNEGREIRAKIESNTNEPWNIISMVRDPIARNVSGFFESLKELIPDIDERIEKKSISLDELFDVFFNKTHHLVADSWFKNQLQPVFSMDVFATPFEKSKGYQFYENSRCRLLIMRAENMNEVVKPAMNEFLGIKNIVLAERNVGDNKYYADIYRAFRNAGLPSDYIDKVYSSQVAQHFYTEDELNKFRERWSKKAN